MKKLLALAGIALIATACTNNDEPVQECGQINLTLENSTAPVWGIERSGFFNGREKWAKGFENQRV